MSDLPEHPNSPQTDPQEPQDPQSPQEPQAPQETPFTAEPTPTSAAPEGLAPSPGIAPPAGITAPELSQPDLTQPDLTQPEQPAQPTQPQFGQDQSQPYGQFPEAQQPAQPQFAQQPYAQDPAQQPYGQDPAAAQYAAAPGGPGTPTGPGGPAGPAGPIGPKKGLSTGAIIGIVGGAIALVVILIVGGIFALGAMSAPSGSAAGASSSNSDSKGFKTPETAQDTVELYLNSVADGDATIARKLAGGATSDEFLTDEALANSLELAAITNIVVDEEASQIDDYEATVSATFDIGDTTVNRDFKLWKTSKTWEIYDGLVSISLDSFKGLEPSVNGIELSKTNSINVFPGAYQLTLGLEAFELDGKTDTFVLANRNDAEVFYEIKPKLTEAATEQYRTLVAESLKKCLESKTFTTECGLEVSTELNGGEKVIDGTITRTLDTEGEAKLKRLAPEVSYSAPTVVSTYDYITVTTTAEVDNAGTRESGTLYGGGSMLTPKVDFAAEKPTVSWE